MCASVAHVLGRVFYCSCLEIFTSCTCGRSPILVTNVSSTLLTENSGVNVLLNMEVCGMLTACLMDFGTEPFYMKQRMPVLGYGCGVFDDCLGLVASFCIM